MFGIDVTRLLPDNDGHFGLTLENASGHIWKNQSLIAANQCARRLVKRIGVRGFEQTVIVIHGHADNRVRPRQRHAKLDFRQRNWLAAADGFFDGCTIFTEMLNQSGHQVFGRTPRKVVQLPADVDNSGAKHRAEPIIVEVCQFHVHSSAGQTTRQACSNESRGLRGNTLVGSP